MIKRKGVADYVDHDSVSLFVALDISSKAVGICVHAFGGRTASGVVNMSDVGKEVKMVSWKRVALIGNLVKDKIMQLANSIHVGNHNIVDVYVEQPFYSAHGSHDTPIKMAHGTILSALYNYWGRCLRTWEGVHVSTWRAWFLGKELNRRGVDKKKAVKKLVYDKYGTKTDSDDEADAIGLMAWVLKNKARPGEI